LSFKLRYLFYINYIKQYILMSVDKTIVELTRTLEQLGTLVEHINGQISGITGRINGTLNELDNAITGITTEAKTLTGQVGDAISQIPKSWVFYLLFITLIVVLKGVDTIENENKRRYRDDIYSGQTTPLSEDKASGHISLPINMEDGFNRNIYNRKYNPNITHRQTTINPGIPYDGTGKSTNTTIYDINHDTGIIKSNLQDNNISRRTYLRKGEEINSNIGVGARYNVSTGTTIPYYNNNTNISNFNNTSPVITSRAEQKGSLLQFFFMNAQDIFYINHHIEIIKNETAVLHNTINDALLNVDGALSNVHLQTKVVVSEVSDTAKNFPRIIIMFALWLLYLIFKLWKNLPQRKVKIRKIKKKEKVVYKKPYIMLPMIPPPQYYNEIIFPLRYNGGPISYGGVPQTLMNSQQNLLSYQQMLPLQYQQSTNFGYPTSYSPYQYISPYINSNDILGRYLSYTPYSNSYLTQLSNVYNPTSSYNLIQPTVSSYPYTSTYGSSNIFGYTNSGLSLNGILPSSSIGNYPLLSKSYAMNYPYIKKT
uniref:t-SNARE coiled-coil homology domain-containing protein n=1 Tax=Strongyloides stercoralis TaxID=6248 RepID=A0AAF5D0U9_STRER